MNHYKVATALLVGSFAFAQTALASSSDNLFSNITPRIVGGEASVSEQFPHMVGLVSAGSDDAESTSLRERQFCGASIINEKWLLSAAHCAFDEEGFLVDIATIRAVVGAIDLATETPTEHVITNMILHPGYDNAAEGLLNDIMVLELANNLPLSASASIVPLYTLDANELAATDTTEAVVATVSGWGITGFLDGDESFPLYEDGLRHVDVPVVSRDICNAFESYDNSIESTQICAGYAAGMQDSCGGDSGGPLVATIDGVVTQIGVVSFGEGCAVADKYGVYTNVSAFGDWISGYIGGSQTAPTGGGSGSSGGGAAWMLLWSAALVLLRRRY